MRRFFCAAVLAMSAATSVQAQWRVGRDSTTRWTAFGRAVIYGTSEALLFSGVDQWQNDPPEWGSGGSGFGKRFASNEGEFLIQEGVTEGLAAAMHRPLGYPHCKCKGTMNRIGWAAKAAITDPLPNGHSPPAVPRIVGAYAGSFAQASWRPRNRTDRVQTALGNGTVSLGLGVLINLFHEFR